MEHAIKSSVNHLYDTVEGSTCLISKTSLIQKQKTNILSNISQLMLDFINCHENALRKLAIMFLTILNAYNVAKMCRNYWGQWK